MRNRPVKLDFPMPVSARLGPEVNYFVRHWNLLPGCAARPHLKFRHSRESGNLLVQGVLLTKIPAFAGMTIFGSLDTTLRKMHYSAYFFAVN
jgi:hypothetical protein